MPGARQRILCVDGAAQMRGALGDLLGREGYEVTLAGGAEEGLSCLSRGGFDLVIVDDTMENGAHDDLLRRLLRADDTPGLLLTGGRRSDRILDLQGVTFVHTPIDVDAFLGQVRSLIGPAHLRRPGQAEFALYVSADSAASARAVDNLRRVLSAYDEAQVRFTVWDVGAEPSPASEEDRVAFLPTLVRRSPAPRAWVLGDLSDARVVVELLRGAGIEPKS